MKRIVDCFIFFNELDLLEVRLEEEYDYVDQFVICESRQTFQGDVKPLFYAENKDRYSRFNDKITHLVVDDLPDTGNIWDREHFQRNYLRHAVADGASADIVIISDADEIISRRALEILRYVDGFIQLDMPMYQYYLNLQAQPHGWTKPFAFSRRLLEEVGDFNFPRTNQEDVIQRFGERALRIRDAGWHFTYLGGADRIRKKLGAFSHTDGWHEHMRSEGAIERHIQIGYVVGNYWHLARYVAIDHTFPRFVVETQDRLRTQGYIRDVFEALETLQHSYRDSEYRMKETVLKANQCIEKYGGLLSRFGIKPFDEEKLLDF